MHGSIRLLFTLLLTAFLGFLTTAGAQDKDKKSDRPQSEKVRFESVDGVNLVGTFYPSSKKNPATVMILHGLGEDRKKAGWVLLAEELQGRGFAVFTFDFRGHGESTELKNKDLFWANPSNRYVKGYNRAESIDYAGFPRGGSYLQILCNDIAAARAVLDRRNDTGACNTSNLFVIGAETSSTLGAIWLNSEFHRHLMKPPPMFPNALPTIPEPRAEGNDIIGCVWLGISNKLGDRAVSLASIFNISARQKAMAMSFWYGEEDTKGKKLAYDLVDKQIVSYNLKAGKKEKEERYKYTTVVEVPKTNLAGSELLHKAKKTETYIGEYLDDVLANRNNEWVERKFPESYYKMRNLGTPTNNPLSYPRIYSKLGDKKTMNNNFSNFEAYLR